MSAKKGPRRGTVKVWKELAPAAADGLKKKNSPPPPPVFSSSFFREPPFDLSRGPVFGSCDPEPRSTSALVSSPQPHEERAAKESTGGAEATPRKMRESRKG